MASYSRKQILTEIKKGNEEILPFIARIYFPSARRVLRRRGFRDKDTPAIFSEVLLDAFVTLSGLQDEIPPLQTGEFDFEEFLNDRLKTYIKEHKHSKTRVTEDSHVEVRHLINEQEITAKCVEVLDEDYQDLLFARVVKNLTYEKIAAQFNYSNAVIAQYEFNKACNQLQAIVEARLHGFESGIADQK